MKDTDLTTIFLCFLKTGLYFTREDTNAVGLAFIDELKKHNAEFQPTKVEQREWNKTFMVNAYPAQFEPLIMACIEERRKSHNLQPRRERPKGPSRYGGGRDRGYGRDRNDGRGGYNRDRDHRDGGHNRDRGGYRDRGQNREGGFNRDRNFNREGGYNRDRSGSGNRDQGYRPRREFDQERGYNRDHGNEYRRPRNDDDQSRRPRRRRIIKPQNPDQENRGSADRDSSPPDSDQ